MELDFDKEINALLRQTAKQDSLFAENDLQTGHLDADEISAFAENAVPEKAKKVYIDHLADCKRCRKSLSEVIRLNSESEPEPVTNEVKVPAPIEIPWYRKLFVFPGLAYTMGGLVIAFTGLTAFVVFQNFEAGSFEMAKSQNSSQAPKSAAPNLDRQMQNSNSLSVDGSVPAANIATDANAAPNATPEFGEENAAKQRNQNGPFADRDSPAEAREDILAKNEVVMGGAKPAGLPKILSEEKPAEKEVLDDRMTDAARATQPAPAQRPAPTPAGERDEAMAKKDSVALSSGSELEADRKATKMKSPVVSRQVGGKTFNQREGVWYDSAYRNQTTKNVRRGTNEYRKLDSGLRSIAEKFAETVVVVWNQTAYRIQ